MGSPLPRCLSFPQTMVNVLIIAMFATGGGSDDILKQISVQAGICTRTSQLKSSMLTTTIMHPKIELLIKFNPCVEIKVLTPLRIQCAI